MHKQNILDLLKQSVTSVFRVYDLWHKAITKAITESKQMGYVGGV